ncbi:hypothetical protein E3A20_03470 [Planctomyces bekefii]|uniref:Uncharacterized protein n=1 Tax=Planctomyces bekefii TaxID=1653850 RepID=A0A5C6MDC1_9PLAN|nr:hypothetical protein E3A20_03470 [Planctomyces bekefii]
MIAKKSRTTLKDLLFVGSWALGGALFPLQTVAAQDDADFEKSDTVDAASVATDDAPASVAPEMDAVETEPAQGGGEGQINQLPPGLTEPKAVSEPAQASTTPRQDGKPDQISSGGRVRARDGDLTMLAPKGWEVFSSLDSLSLLLQVPQQAGLRYQRNIQVASFSEPRFIDEMTAKEYEKVIVQKYSSISSAVEDYQIRNHLTVDLADGRQGLLFYSEFKLEGVPLMQAHILVSSATRHYLMTFTDVAEHFENDAANQFLSEAWASMISAELPTKTPQRYETFAAVGVGVVGFTVLGFIFMAYRTWRSGRSYRQYADGRDVDGDFRSIDKSGFSGELVTNDPQALAASGHDEKLGTQHDDLNTQEDIAV